MGFKVFFEAFLGSLTFGMYTAYVVNREMRKYNEQFERRIKEFRKDMGSIYN